jgi:curved DNA-binding protein CbpA
MSEEDFYETLGVLPSAEDIVIKAAYRVLAQRYHPDRWRGSPTEAHKRMADINRAYETLEDPVKRAAYDKQRSREAQARYRPNQDDGQEEFFRKAIIELESRWKIATDIFPDLTELRDNLAKLSSTLAFSYATLILEKKSFNNRQALANGMTEMFLERYFGTDRKIKATAYGLILANQKEAARTLNQLVEIMGSDIEPDLLLSAVKERHANAFIVNINSARSFINLDDFLKSPSLATLMPLCEAVGYSVKEEGGLFDEPRYTVKGAGLSVWAFDSRKDFISWGKDHFKKI